jgi:hypothetical protein
MKIAAFDLGSTGAMAFNEVGRRATRDWIGHIELKGSRGRRFALWRSWLLTHAPADADTFIYERPFSRGQDATRCGWGYAAVIEEIADIKGAALLDVTPAEIKKWATGSGKASKEEMIASAQIMGYGGDNEHEADAYLLLRFAETTLKKGPIT